MVKKVLFNTAAQVAGKAVTASSTLFLTIIIGRSLGPAGYGDFVKIFTFVGYFYIFTDLGLNAAYVKLSQGDKSANYIHTLFGMRLLLSIALALLSIIVSQLLPYDAQSGTGFSPLVKIGIIIASTTIITQASLTSINAYFQKNLRYGLSTVATIVGSILTLALTISVFLNSPRLNMYVSAYVIGSLFIILTAWHLAKSRLGLKIIPSFSKSVARSLLGYSWPIGLALIFNLIYFRIDIFILTYTRAPQEVGIYGLAYQFFEASLALPIFFANSLFPLFVNLYSQNKAKFVKETKKWVFILLGISSVATLGLIISSFIIPFVFEQFEGSQVALIILSLGMPFFFISALFWHIIIVTNKQKLLIPVYFLGGSVNLLLNLIFIPQYGFMAAAIVTVFSEALITALLVAAIKYPTQNHREYLAN